MSDEQFPLPSITKKLLYVDTFAISNMVKALNPAGRNGSATFLEGALRALTTS